MGRVTLQTVADRVGVSRMTVSNAFSRPDQLSAELRERILAAADELGYCGPDPAARALACGRSGVIGFLLTDSLSYAFTDEVATRFLGAVAAELEPSGVAMTLLSSPRGTGRVPARDVVLDGAVVYSVDADSPALDWLRRRDVPLVFVDQVAEPGVPSVNIDDRAGARAAAEHVLALGHRRVGIITEATSGPYDEVVDTAADEAHHVIRERLRGWLEPLQAAGLRPVVVKQANNGEEEGRRSAELLLGRAEPPTALLCMSDLLALGALHAAEARGVRVPTDLSVVGFDDAPLAARTRPALTTVRQPVDEKARVAARAVLAAIDAADSPGAGRRASRARHVLLPTELVVRDSTGPAPTSSR